jgi:hypothetical protein
MTSKYWVTKYMGSSWIDGNNKCIGNMAFGLFASEGVIVVNVTDLKTCRGGHRGTGA